MDPEFQRPLITILVGGLVVVGIATTVLVLAFRAAKDGRPPHLGLIGGLVAFLFVCCAILLALAYQ